MPGLHLRISALHSLTQTPSVHVRRAMLMPDRKSNGEVGRCSVILRNEIFQPWWKVIYVFLIFFVMNNAGIATNGLQSSATGGGGLNLVFHDKIISNEPMFAWNNTFSEKTTFVNDTNTFYQHVDKGPRIWLWGPHKGSQAKLQYFPKRPLGFVLPIIIGARFEGL